MKGSKGPLPRSRVLATIRDMRRVTKEIQGLWTVSSTVYVPSNHPSGGHQEPRPADQYPENSRWSWADLYTRARKIRDLADALMALASEEYHKLPAEVKEK